MKAAILRTHGGAENIEYGDWPDPVAGEGEIVVDVTAASLNRRDWWILRNPARQAAPGILGSDAAGRRRDTGEAVIVYPAIGWGDREDAPSAAFQILGVPRQGVFAEQVVVPVENLYPKPGHLSDQEAACLGIAGLTAWRALTTRGAVGPGSTVLVTGAGAGTGVFAVQIAAALGAQVIVTTSTERKRRQLLALGAAAAIDRTDERWPAAVREVATGGVDLAIDSAGAATWPGILECLRPGGTLVGFGDTAGESATIDVGRVFFQQLSIHGTTLGSPREFEAFLEHVALERWRPLIDSVYPLSEAGAAFRRLDAPDRVGKVVLDVPAPARPRSR